MKIIFKAVGIVALFASMVQLAHCQNPAGSQVLGPFGGLHDTDSSVTIEDNQAQATSNVRLTKDGRGLKSREGFSLNAALTYSTSPIVGAHYFKTQGGNLVRLAMHDNLVSRSINNGAFSNIVTTAPAGIQFYDCVDNYGVAYCLSSSKTEPFSDNGSAVTWYPTQIPAGTQIEMTPDRMIVSGTAANPNRINYSQSGALTTFTAGINAESAFTDDIGISGDKITAIKYALGRLIFWTNNSMGACQGTGQFDTVCYDISKTVGTIEPPSVVYYNGAVYFRGTDSHFYGYDGQNLTKLTREQSVLIATFQNSQIRSDVQTSVADFNAGTQSPPNSWSSTITANSIQPSSWTATDSSQANFGAGTIINFSSKAAGGGLRFDYLLDNFTDGDYTASPTWSKLSSAYTCTAAVASGSMTVTNASGQCIFRSSSTATYGTWTWKYSESASAGKNAAIAFISSASATSPAYAISYVHSASSFTIRLTSASSLGSMNVPSEYSIIGSSAILGVPGDSHTYKVNRTEAGAFNVFRDDVSIITGTDATPVYSNIFAIITGYFGAGPTVVIDAVATPSTASFQSQEFNTAFSTPTWGNLVATATITGSSTLLWNTRVAATSGGAKDTAVSVLNGAQIASAQKQYVTYVASATASAADAPVIISTVTLNAATTGQFWSQCITGNTVASFGVLSCAITTAGGGSSTLYGRAAATCAGLTGAWSATTNNAAFAPSVNEAFQWRVDSTLTHATDTVRLDACVLNWTEAQVASTFGGVFEDDIYWSVVADSGLKQNKVILYDVLHGAFFPWAMRVSAMLPTETVLYMGGSDGGNIYQFGGVNTDTGTAITASWTSKDFPLGDPTIEKSIDRLSVIMKNQLSGTLSLDYTVNGSSTITKSLSMVGTTGNPMVLRNFNTGMGTKGNVFRVRPYGSAPWEIYGIKMDFQTLPWRIQ